MKVAESVGSCPLCGGGMSARYQLPHIWHRPGGTTPYHVGWCKACDYGALQPRPSPDELLAFYDTNYFPSLTDESLWQEKGIWGAAAKPSNLLDRLRVQLAWRADHGQSVDAAWLDAMLEGRRSRICDLGCGNGELMLGLRERGHEVVGIEVSPDAVNQVRARGLEIHQGSAEEIPPEVAKGHWDAVVLTHVLEHCSDPILAVRNAVSLLKPGGAFFVEVPNSASIAAEWSGPFWFHCDAGRHLNFFTPKSLGAIAELAGLTPLRQVFCGFSAIFQNERVAAEQLVYDGLYANGGPSSRAAMNRPGVGRLWGELLVGLLARPPRKYEIMGLMARRQSNSSGN